MRQDPHWLVDLPESESAMNHESQNKSTAAPVGKCQAFGSCVTQCLVRCIGRGRRAVAPAKDNPLTVFLAVVCTFEALTILLLLNSYEACM